MKKYLYLVFSFMLLGLCSCTVSSESEQPTTETSAQTIYKDQYVEVKFEGVGELPSIDGMSAINLTLKNLGDEEITVLFMDSSVNGTMVQFVSGVPATMQGGKEIVYTLSFNNETAGISDYNEIDELEFSLSVNDANFAEISRSELLTVEISS